MHAVLACTVTAAAAHLQVTKQLFEHIWGQWCSDTQSIISGLPEALQGGQPAPGLLLTIERWLMLLKVGKALQTRAQAISGPEVSFTAACMLTMLLEALIG